MIYAFGPAQHPLDTELGSADLRAKKRQKVFGLVCLQLSFSHAVKHAEALNDEQDY